MSPERVNCRKGYRQRELDTRARARAGDVAILKLRSGSYFSGWLLDLAELARWLFFGCGGGDRGMLAGSWGFWAV